MRDAFNCLERSATISKDDNNSIKNSNNGKNGNGDFGGRRREEISTSQGDHPQNILRLSVEAAADRCTLGDISYTLEKIWGRHVPSSPVVSGSYIASFCGIGGGGGDKGGGKKRDNDYGNNNHVDEEDKEDG